MRAKDFNAGLRGVLFEAKHYAQMGSAVWLYGWLVLRQTRQVGATGLVLGGRPVSYREIESETGFPRKTLERWMRVLRRAGYVETRAVPAGIVIRITKAKKFPQDFPASRRVQPGFGGSEQGPTRNQSVDGRQLTGESPEASGVADLRGVSANLRTALRESAGAPAQSCGHLPGQADAAEGVADRIGSNTGSKRETVCDPQRTFESRRSAIDRKQELVRRELQVGTGPEVRKSRG